MALVRFCCGKERKHSPCGVCGTRRDICYNSLRSALRSYNNNISTEFPEGVSETTGKADKFQSIYQSTSRQMKQQSCLVRNALFLGVQSISVNKKLFKNKSIQWNSFCLLPALVLHLHPNDPPTYNTAAFTYTSNGCFSLT